MSGLLETEVRDRFMRTGTPKIFVARHAWQFMYINVYKRILRFIFVDYYSQTLHLFAISEIKISSFYCISVWFFLRCVVPLAGLNDICGFRKKDQLEVLVH